MIDTIKDIINTFNDNIDLFISFMALFISFCALGWNIIRDLIIDRPRLKIKVDYGSLISIRESSNKQFIPDNEGYDVSSESKGLLFTVVNHGKEQIVVNGIGGNYKLLDILLRKSKKHLSIICKELPREVKPHGVFNKFVDNSSAIKDIKDKKIAFFWVQDVEGRKWNISKKDMRKLIKKINLI